MPVPRVRLFVYGSLRRGELHHDELDGAVFLDVVRTVASYRVGRFGCYPALVPGSTSVLGELYEVPAVKLPALDAFEGPGYRRANVRLFDGSEAQAYFLAEASHE
jgi:gamma-glutamylcyclotransferase (GGCT)/AIG2-like uncharacterized protein YtfP